MAQQLQKKFIGNNQVDGSKILLENGQSIKIKDSTGTEVELVKLGASNEVLVKGQEVALKANLDQEIVDRASGDASTLSSANTYTDGEITALETSVNASISAEETARIAGDASTLASSQAYTDQEVLAEENARIAADSNLQSQIDAISGGGSGSISALQAELDATQAGAGLQPDGSYIAPSVTYISMATSLMDADMLLDSAIAGVASATSGLDDQVQEIISSAGLNADGTHPGFGGSYYLGGENNNRMAILMLDNEIHVVQEQVNNIVSNVDPGALDSLTEVVSAFQEADANLNGAITALSTGLSADIDAEEAARIAADTALQGEIDAEEVARAAADVTLQNNINAESSARQAADTALDGRLDVLEARVWVKEKFSIVNGQTSVTLSFVPFAGSMSAFVDRLAIHEGASEDYTVSGTTMTFLNDLVSPGQSQIGNGDTVYVKYQKNA